MKPVHLKSSTNIAQKFMEHFTEKNCKNQTKKSRELKK